MLKPWWYATQRGVKVPAGLILAAKDGIDLGTDWSVWTDADGYFLRGTDSDVDVGTTGARSSVTVASGYGGGHVTGSSRYIIDTGQYGYNSGHDYANPSNDPNSQGNHRHNVYVAYRPAYEQTRLIQAQTDALVPLGAVMFGDAANTKQLLYSLNSARFFRAGTAKTTGVEAKSFTVQSVSYSHDHLISQSWTAGGLTTTAQGYYQGTISGGPNHNHGNAGNISVGLSLKAIALRAFEIVDQAGIKGLIGMWANTGIPDKWELVAAASDRCILFSDTALGELSGADTLNVSGGLQNQGHSHPFGAAWTGSTKYISAMHHINTVYHGHSFSASGRSYLPERYHIKFIRYVGG